MSDTPLPTCTGGLCVQRCECCDRMFSARGYQRLCDACRHDVDCEEE